MAAVRLRADLCECVHYPWDHFRRAQGFFSAERYRTRTGIEYIRIDVVSNGQPRTQLRTASTFYVRRRDLWSLGAFVLPFSVARVSQRSDFHGVARFICDRAYSRFERRKRTCDNDIDPVGSGLAVDRGLEFQEPEFTS